VRGFPTADTKRNQCALFLKSRQLVFIPEIPQSIGKVKIMQKRQNCSIVFLLYSIKFILKQKFSSKVLTGLSKSVAFLLSIKTELLIVFRTSLLIACKVKLTSLISGLVNGK